MALFTSPEQTPLNNVPPASPPPTVVDTASVYHNREFKNKLTTFISGNSWTVNYYNKYNGDDDATALSNDNASPTLNQFQLIKKMELRLQAALNHTTPTDTQVSTVRGEAMVYPIIVPSVGDVIFGDLGEGMVGKFEVVQVTRQSLFKESAWMIEFTLTDYVDDYIFNHMEDRVVNTLIFDITVLNTDKGPLRTESEYNRNVDRLELMRSLTANLYVEYYNHYHGTFIITPDTGLSLYDPFAIDFFNKIIDERYRGGREAPRLFDFRNVLFQYEIMTVWDAMINGSMSYLKRGAKYMTELDVTAFGAHFIMNTIQTTQLESVIHPIDSPNGEALDGIADIDTLPYVASAAFYDNDEANFETVDNFIKALIDGTLPVYSEVVEYANTLEAMDTKTRFYNTIVTLAVLSVIR